MCYVRNLIISIIRILTKHTWSYFLISLFTIWLPIHNYCFSKFCHVVVKGLPATSEGYYNWKTCFSEKCLPSNKLIYSIYKHYYCDINNKLIHWRMSVYLCNPSSFYMFTWNNIRFTSGFAKCRFFFSSFSEILEKKTLQFSHILIKSFPSGWEKLHTSTGNFSRMKVKK